MYLCTSTPQKERHLGVSLEPPCLCEWVATSGKRASPTTCHGRGVKHCCKSPLPLERVCGRLGGVQRSSTPHPYGAHDMCGHTTHKSFTLSLGVPGTKWCTNSDGTGRPWQRLLGDLAVLHIVPFRTKRHGQPAHAVLDETRALVADASAAAEPCAALSVTGGGADQEDGLESVEREAGVKVGFVRRR